MWMISQMEECSLSCEEILGVFVSENSPCDLKLNHYIALYLMDCNSSSNHQITLMGINDNPFVNAVT